MSSKKQKETQTQPHIYRLLDTNDRKENPKMDTEKRHNRHRGMRVRITMTYSQETWQDWRQWRSISKLLTENENKKPLSTKIFIHSEKIIWKSKWKTCSEQKMWRGFIAGRLDCLIKHSTANFWRRKMYITKH